MGCRCFVYTLLLLALFPRAGPYAAARSLRLPERDRVFNKAPRGDSDAQLSTLPNRATQALRLPQCDFQTPSKLRMKPDVPHERFFDNYTEVSYEAARRYRIQMQLGEGVEGTVVGAVDVATGTEVAIKKLRDVTRNYHHANSILRQVMLANGMAGLGGMVQVKRFIPPANPGNFTTLFIVMERMAGDIFHERGVTRRLDLRTQKWLVYQMLSALQSMHA
eukprot:jgi/Tetstr1/420753/TSEL_011830.t1